MFRFYILIFLSVSMLTGCASQALQAPVNKPIISLGEKNLPKNNDYILYIKSGERIPMVIEINGDVFTKPVRFKSYVTAKHGMYMAKHKVSENGKDWYPVKHLLAIRLSAKLDATGSKLKIHINKRAKKSRHK